MDEARRNTNAKYFMLHFHEEDNRIMVYSPLNDEVLKVGSVG